MRNRNSLAVIIVAFCLLLVVARARVLLHWWPPPRPLGETPRIEFPSEATSQLAVAHFLEGNYTSITSVEALPALVAKAFTEKTSSRLLLANPGERFEVTDVISDPSVPRMRLLFAGIRNDQVFVHYEQGGRAHFFIVALFRLASANEMEPFWQGFCVSPAHNITELRSKIMNRECR
jgi:hypothetical protein